MRSSSRITSSGFGEEHRDDGMLLVGLKLGDCCSEQTVWEDVLRALAAFRIQRMDEAIRGSKTK